MITGPAGSEQHSMTRLASRVFILAALIAVTMLGNLRLQASEATARSPAAPVVPASPFATDLSLTAWASEDDDDEASVAEQDDLRLVPAIYAWDPDVRFVYFRHVSKWM